MVLFQGKQIGTFCPSRATNPTHPGAKRCIEGKDIQLKRIQLTGTQIYQLQPPGPHIPLSKNLLRGRGSQLTSSMA
eukprot:319857-Chlamydomonas_euryale.AAC.8